MLGLSVYNISVIVFCMFTDSFASGVARRQKWWTALDRIRRGQQKWG